MAEASKAGLDFILFLHHFIHVFYEVHDQLCPCSDLLNQFFPTMQHKNINLCTTLLGFLLIHHPPIVSVFNQGLNCIGLHKQAASFWHHKTKTTSHIPTFASPLQMVSNGFYPDGYIPCVIPGYRSEKLVLLFFLLDLSCHKLMH